MDIQIVLKLAERCNINCEYCYMYTGPDQSWRSRPKFLSDQNLDLLVDRFVEHSQKFPDAGRTLEIHGGEPLLFGKKRMGKFLSSFRSRLPPEKVNVCIQTNGVLLDNEWLDIFVQFKVQVSISCDGPPPMHDLYRKFHNGESTGRVVESAIRLCLSRSAGSALFGGVLAVANPNFDSARLVRYFYNLGVRQLDFLLPDANYVSPPAHLPQYCHGQMLKFMTKAFDEWIALRDRTFQIRTFRELILGIFGKKSSYDAFGGDLSTLPVVESDGSYQLLDVLHICSEEATRTSLHIREHSFSDFVSMAASTYPGPCRECISCPAFKSCGGGYLPHRFDGKSYDNPSFYCDVLLGLFEHIHRYLVSVTPVEMWRAKPGLTSA